MAPILLCTMHSCVKALKAKPFHRAETQRRRENQNQDMGALSCVNPLQPLGSNGLSVSTGEAEKNVVSSASLRLCARIRF